MLQFSFSLPRIFPLWERSQFKIPPPKIHDLENAPEKPARALKYLIKLNHANHAILFHERKFYNHVPHVSFLNYPNMEYGKSGKGREWMDGCANVTYSY